MGIYKRVVQNIGKRLKIKGIDDERIAKFSIKMSNEMKDLIIAGKTGCITIGGWDQAYDYWRSFGRFWNLDDLDILRSIMGG